MNVDITRMIYTQLPLYLTWVAGIVLALVFWRRHPRVSLLAALAFAVLLTNSVIGNYLAASLPLMLHERGLTLNQLGPLLFARGMVQSVISAAATGLLIAAAFGWRHTKQ